MNKNENKLDELDERFFEELPFLVDVFVNSLNKLKDIISFHFQQIETAIENFEKNNTGWKPDPLPISFTPFFQNEKLKSIEALSSKFTFDKSITIKETDNEARAFAISFGFWFSDLAENGKPFLYIGIYRYKLETEILPISFYESLKVHPFKKVIEHVSEGKKEETIEVRVFEINQDKITNGFQIFLNEVLQPYLKELQEKVYNKNQ